MRPRSLLIALVAAALLAPLPASAAPKPKPKPKPKPLPKACLLLEDTRGDGDWNLAPPVKSDNVDIVSADIATGPTEVVAVLRMAAMNFSNDQWASLGYAWTFGATAGGARYEFRLRRTAGGEYIGGGSIGGVGIAGLTPTVVGNDIVWKFKRKGIAQLARPNLVFSSFSAITNILSSTADDAQSSKSYKDRQPSCVRAL
jgi:hypothetical protein